MPERDVVQSRSGFRFDRGEIVPAKLTLGMDIGGTHATAALVGVGDGRIVETSRVRVDVDSAGNPEPILEAWARCAREAIERGAATGVGGVGIAMPGPFDYPGGICTMQGVGKYDALFGTNVRAELKRRVAAIANAPMIFMNDAACFALGECRAGAGAGAARAIGITLGTGLGSAFVAGGRIVESGTGVPENGWLYNAPFRGEAAEDWFSGRGLRRLAARRGFPEGANPRLLAESAAADPRARALFEEFGTLLGEFLGPIVRAFAADRVVVGGSIARSFDLFGPALRAGPAPIPAASAMLFEDAALVGAADLPLVYSEPAPSADHAKASPPKP